MCECGKLFVPNQRGRPRRFCAECAAPTAAGHRWREQNPEAAAAINARKRVAHESRACLVCDEEFVPQRVTGRFCSDKCRWRWKYELGRLRKAA